MADITLSKAVRSNLLNLQSTATQLAKTQERLATGLRVNSALDNPSNFFTSSSLNSRASDMSQLLDAMSNGIQTLEAADNGLTAITKNLESMQSTLNQARQDKSFQTASYTLSTIDPSATPKLSFTGGAFATSTDLSITTVGSGQYVNTTSAYAAPAAAANASYATEAGQDYSATGSDDITGGTLTIAYGSDSVDVTITGGVHSANLVSDTVTEIQNALAGTALDGVISVAGDATTGFTLTATSQEDKSFTVTGTPEATMFGVQQETAGSNGTLDFSVNGTAISLDDTTTGDTLTHAVAAINSALNTAGANFQAYEAGTKLGIRATTTDAGSLSIGGADADLFGTPDSQNVVAGTTSAALTLANTVDNLVTTINSNSTLSAAIKASNDNGKLRIQNLSTQALTIAGANSSSQITGVSTVSSTIAGNSVRDDLHTQYNTLIDQLDKLSDDASFNGVNLLRGDKLQITFNETGTSEIAIQAKDGKTINSANLGVKTSLTASDLDSDTAIDGYISQVKTALNTVRSQSSSFGSNLSVVQNRQDFTKNMINTLQTGASNLTLADSNEQAANLLALQTRQQLSSTALSLASQADQNVLRLF